MLVTREPPGSLFFAKFLFPLPESSSPTTRRIVDFHNFQSGKEASDYVLEAPSSYYIIFVHGVRGW